ncbi:DVU0298 family protein [Planctomycetota bacterium]
MPIKKHLRELLDQGDLEQIAELAMRKKRALGILIPLTFDPDEQIAWRAVEAMGLAADRVAEDDPEFVRGHLRKLYWLLSEESGGVCWRAPEAMAEIVRRRPELFADYVPIVVSLIESMAEEDLDHFRPGALWAIGRLGPLAADHVQGVLPAVTAALDHREPQVRGMAVWCLGQVGREELLAGRPDLLADEGPVDLYQQRRLDRTSVGELVRRTFRG